MEEPEHFISNVSLSRALQEILENHKNINGRSWLYSDEFQIKSVSFEEVLGNPNWRELLYSKPFEKFQTYRSEIKDVLE